jgi:hypothetical protein
LKGRKRTSAERERSDGKVTKMTVEKQERLIDPVFVLGVFLLVVFMIMLIIDHMPVTLSPGVIAIIFILGMGTGSQLLRLKQATDRRRAEGRR